MKVRIGIDVGGTFTDAVAIDDTTYKVIGSVKVPTTHAAETGVAAGIIQVIEHIMRMHEIAPEDVTFIAHGTTQATNALLEGDVATVGILTLGSGIEGAKSKADTDMGKIELAKGKFLQTQNVFVNSAAGERELGEGILKDVCALKENGCGSIVAAEAFSVDNPEHEDLVLQKCEEAGIPGTATSDISKLYGLRIRTRTAVVNASILPKMLEAANMTEGSIKEAGIESQLMVMRCDGGVMTVNEVRRRPILTILSGPAAGVAGAMMYEKLTDGIFLEVGGTSTDISCVKDGKVVIKYSEIGGHKTYLNSLDVRTVGIGGGSMVQLNNLKAIDVGPRSAHIAGLQYEVYASPEDIEEPVLTAVNPMPTDPAYACIVCPNGKRFALTLSGAANLAGYVPEGDYARGNLESARKAWEPLAHSMGMTVEEAAEQVLLFAAKKNGQVVQALMQDYHMDVRTTMLIGGGGGASAVVPFLAKHLGCKTKNADNAPVISTIGVALAMVRDMVERMIPNPTQEDIIAVRREAELLAINSGAAPGTVEVSIEIDPQKNMVRAIAIGSTEMRTKDLGSRRLEKERLLEIVAENLDVPVCELQILADNGSLFAVQHERVTKKFVLFRSREKFLRLIDDEGVIRLQKRNANIWAFSAASWKAAATKYIEDMTEANEGGRQLPSVYVILGRRIIDLSGMQNLEQIIALGDAELMGIAPDEKLMLICTNRVD